MRITMRMLTAVLLLCGVAAALGPQGAGQNQPKPTLNRVFTNTFSGVEHEFIDAADAMPADKYTFAPTNGDFKGVRNFGQQVRHVAAANYLLGAAIMGAAKPPVDTAGESGPESINTKDAIMKYLRDSFAYLDKAIASISTEQEALAMTKNPFGRGEVPKLAMIIEANAHPFDHYGQMVEYLRMNNIIPPASRPRPRR